MVQTDQLNQINELSLELCNLIIPNNLKDIEDIKKFKSVLHEVDETQISLELFFLRLFTVDLASYMLLKQSKKREVIMDEIHILIKQTLNDHNNDWIYEVLVQRINQYSEIFRDAHRNQEVDPIAILATLFASQLTKEFENNPELALLAAKDFSLYLNEIKSIISDEMNNINTYEQDETKNSRQEKYETEKMMKVDIKVNFEIHFHQQTEASIFMESTGSGFDRKYGEVLLFCLVALRQMVNANKPEITNSLCLLLQDVGSIFKESGNYVPQDGTKLVQYEGNPGRKRFIGALEFCVSKGTYKFNWKLKGFGIFNGGLGYYSPVSVTLLLQHLILKNRDDENFVEALIEAAKLCGQLYYEGVVGITNQSKYALDITNMSIRHLFE